MRKAAWKARSAGSAAVISSPSRTVISLAALNQLLAVADMRHR